MAPLIGEAVYRFRVEENLRQAYELQTMLNSLLHFSFERSTLEELLGRALSCWSPARGSPRARGAASS